MPSAFLTANDLRTGEIVYWTQRGVWSLDPGQALIAEAAAHQETLTQILEDPKAGLEVVGPYLVTTREGSPTALSPEAPKKLRERRRLAGPGAALLPETALA